MSLDQLNQPLLLPGETRYEQERRLESENHNGGDNFSARGASQGEGQRSPITRYGDQANYSNYCLYNSEANYCQREQQEQKERFKQRQQQQQPPLSPYSPLMPVKFSPNQAKKQGSSSYLATSCGGGDGGKMSSKFKWLAILGLLLLMSFVCLYGVWTWHQFSSQSSAGEPFRRKLKLVSLFARHGDRAPSNNLPPGDRHAERAALFWPNGLHNLTDSGRIRAYKVGLETRRRYNEYLGFNSSHILAFSSTIYRCIETMEIILRSLYNTDTSVEKGLLLAEQFESCQTSLQATQVEGPNSWQFASCRLPTGSGSPDEWRRVKVDTETVPTLVYERLNSCKYRIEHPDPMDKDLMVDSAINSLPNVELVKEFVKQRYSLDFDFGVNSLWSTVNSELNLIRTQSTMEYIQHYSDWVNKPIVVRPEFNITMFDFMEAVVVLLYKDRIKGPAHYVQNSPIVSSLVESQLVALGYNATNDRQRAYKDKRMILYTSHDSVMQQFLQTLNIINFDGAYEERYAKYHKSSDLDQFLNGLRMCRYGLAIRFELWQLEPLGKQHGGWPANRMAHEGGSSSSSSSSVHHRHLKGKLIRERPPVFNVVEAAIYNKEDARYDSIEYEPIEFGTACRKMFKRKYPGSKGRKELESFYDGNFEIDRKLACPFELFRNVTAYLMFDEEKLEQLCHYKQQGKVVGRTNNSGAIP